MQFGLVEDIAIIRPAVRARMSRLAQCGRTFQVTSAIRVRLATG